MVLQVNKDTYCYGINLAQGLQAGASLLEVQAGKNYLQRKTRAAVTAITILSIIIVSANAA